jgi:predicted Zn-dependent protease
MKEAIHTEAIKLIIDEVKKDPMNIGLHQKLAAAYILCYQNYQKPAEQNAFKTFTQKQYDSPEMQTLFEKNARCALEELKLILALDPQHIWAMSSCAQVYRDLKLVTEEMKTYESLSTLIPDNREVIYELGKIYFRLGYMAQGLALYRQLKEQNSPYAAELINHYDLQLSS